MSRTARLSLLTLGLALSGCVVPTPAPTPTTPPTSASTPSPSPSAPLFLGATGYGPLTLGMTKKQARDTGLVTDVAGTKGSCGAPDGDISDGHLTGAPTPTDAVVGTLFFSENSDTLIAIYAYGTITTPEGIGLGSTVAELKAAYPSTLTLPDENDVSNDGRGYVELPGGKASYRLSVLDGKVAELSLDSVDQDCYE